MEPGARDDGGDDGRADGVDAEASAPASAQSTGAPNPVPFLVALVGFVIVAVLAFVFLRDEDLALARPEVIRIVDDTTVAVYGTAGVDCPVFERAQVDFDDDRIYLEFAVRERQDCAEVPADIEVVLPRPIGGRDVVPGVGRVKIPCEVAGGERAGRRVHCRPPD